jgi:hypothetical protein
MVVLRSALASGLAVVALAACVNTVEPTEADLRVLVTGRDLLEFRSDHQLDADAEKVTKMKLFGGLWLLSYEYEPGQGLFVTSEASVGPSGSGEEHVDRSVRALKVGSWFGGDLELREQVSPVEWGTGSRFFLLLNEGEPIGNAFFAHSDERGLTTMFAGVYFSDHEQFADFIRPKLEALETHDPSQ